jgi:hypothetical protein
MKTKKAKKSILAVRRLASQGAIDPQQSRRILGGGSPWTDKP